MLSVIASAIAVDASNPIAVAIPCAVNQCFVIQSCWLRLTCYDRTTIGTLKMPAANRRWRIPVHARARRLSGSVGDRTAERLRQFADQFALDQHAICRRTVGAGMIAHPLGREAQRKRFVSGSSLSKLRDGSRVQRVLCLVQSLQALDLYDCISAHIFCEHEFLARVFGDLAVEVDAALADALEAIQQLFR